MGTAVTKSGTLPPLPHSWTWEKSGRKCPRALQAAELHPSPGGGASHRCSVSLQRDPTRHFLCFLHPLTFLKWTRGSKAVDRIFGLPLWGFLSISSDAPILISCVKTISDPQELTGPKFQFVLVIKSKCINNEKKKRKHSQESKFWDPSWTPTTYMPWFISLKLLKLLSHLKFEK